VSLFAAKTPDKQATEALTKFAAHLMAKQETDGSWKSGRTGYEPPIGDTSEILTMQALLVLSSAEQRGLAGDGWSDARDRALAWLRKNKPGDSNQALTLQTQIAQRFGKPEDMLPLVKELLGQQNADGGWSQLKDRPSDALATGQTLYVLALTGADAQQPAIQLGQAFLTRTQLKDGSWWVPSRDKGRKGLAISHYGSGWATLGLIVTLKNAK
jgi:squalene cyclase